MNALIGALDYFEQSVNYHLEKLGQSKLTERDSCTLITCFGYGKSPKECANNIVRVRGKHERI